MASLGVLSMEHPVSALKLLLESLSLDEDEFCFDNLADDESHDTNR